MPRNSVAEALARRAQVAHLELRGASPAVIARELYADRRTIHSDLRAIAQDRARYVDVPAARLRLLESAALVELEAWKLGQAVPVKDWNAKLGALGKVLAAQ